MPRVLASKLMEFLKRKRKAGGRGEARELSGARLHAAREAREGAQPARDRVPGLKRKSRGKRVKRVQRLGALERRSPRAAITDRRRGRPANA